MPTPFNLTNLDQKKPNRWAPILNHWKVWFIIYRLIFWSEHMIELKNWTFEGIDGPFLYSSNWNFSSNWFFQENWLIEFVCNRCWRICNEKGVATSVWGKLSKISSWTNSTLHKTVSLSHCSSKYLFILKSQAVSVTGLITWFSQSFAHWTKFGFMRFLWILNIRFFSSYFLLESWFS